MSRKYKYTGETMEYDGHLLHRIERLSDGKIGGWIESEENLSHECGCWIDDNAKVYENARVSDNAIVCDNAEVSGEASVMDNARVYGKATVTGCSSVYDDAQVYEDAFVYDSNVYDDAVVHGDAALHLSEAYGDVDLYGYAWHFESMDAGSLGVIEDFYTSVPKAYGHADTMSDAKDFTEGFSVLSEQDEMQSDMIFDHN